MVSTPLASSRSLYSSPTPLTRIRSAMFAQLRRVLSPMPVDSAIEVRPWRVAHVFRRSSVVLIFAVLSLSAKAGPMLSMSVIL